MAALLRLPALQALLVQLAALVLAASLLAISGLLGTLQPTILHVCIAQGVFAAMLAWRVGMPYWWLPIHLLFVPTLALLLAMRLPPWIFLLLLLVMLPLYWQTFRTRVPYYPSSAAVRDEVIELLPARPLRFVDIGSGFGGLVLDIAVRRPDCMCEGVELAPLPWCVSVLRARLSRGRTRFMFGDYANLDFSGHDVVFAYLSPAAMPALWRKACAEMQPGALLLSYEFAVPDAPASLSVQLESSGPFLYGWRF